MGWPYQQKPPMGWPLDYDSPFIRDLVGAWFMQEGSGNRVFDLSGNGSAGTFSGHMIWDTGLYGKCPKGEGDSDNIDLDGVISIATDLPWTVVFWAKQETSSIAGMVCGDADASADFIWLHGGTGFRVRCLNADTTFDDYKDFTAWHQYVMMSDGSNLIYYRDGVYVNQAASANTRLYIADLFAGLTTRTWDLDGWLDHFIVFNRALPASEIALLYRYPFWIFKDPTEIALLGGYQAVGISMPLLMQQMNHFNGGAVA